MTMRPIAIIQAPFATRSGYGDMSRDIIRHVIALDKYDVQLVSAPWGSCPMNALEEKRDAEILSRMVQVPLTLPRQPELYIHITVPNEFQKVAKYNIGITAGIETTLCSPEWIEGCNRMDLVVATSEHSANVLRFTKVEQKDQDGNVVNTQQVTVPVEVLPNCVHTDVFKKLYGKEMPETINAELSQIKESFNYLFVGHWLKGGFGEDRKNVSMLIKVFCEAFKNIPSGNRPGLILKTSGATFSIMDQEECLEKIRQVRASVGPTCPNVYLLHGDLTEEEMNGLYNHPKIKAHVSFTKGEGFGRPLLEATQSDKPIIASGWSGHLDFLNKDDAILVGGELKKVDAGAVWPGVIIPESEWFNVNPSEGANALYYVFKNHGKATNGAWRLSKKAREGFSYEAVLEKTKELFDKHVPAFPTFQPLQLPSLKKI